MSLIPKKYLNIETFEDFLKAFFLVEKTESPELETSITKDQPQENNICELIFPEGNFPKNILCYTKDKSYEVKILFDQGDQQVLKDFYTKFKNIKRIKNTAFRNLIADTRKLFKILDGNIKLYLMTKALDICSEHKDIKIKDFKKSVLPKDPLAKIHYKYQLIFLEMLDLHQKLYGHNIFIEK